jgi:hypothetical protein
MKTKATVGKTHKAVVETLEGRTLMSAVDPTAGLALQAASGSSNNLTISLDASRTTLNTTAHNVTRSFKFSDNDIFKSAAAKAAPVSITSYTLIDGDTNQPFKGYENLTGPLTLDAPQAASHHVNIRANVTNGAESGSVLFAFDGDHVTYIENAGPQPSDYNSDFYAWTPSTGDHTIVASAASGKAMILTLTVIDDPHAATPSASNQPAQMKALAVAGEPVVNNLVVYNVDTNQPVMYLYPGATIDCAALGTSRLTIVANATNAKSIAFGLDNNGGMYNDNSNPFSFSGETNGKLNPYSFSNGNHTVLATPFGGAYATGWAGSMYRLNFTVKNAGYVAPATSTPAPVTQPVQTNGSPTVGSLVLYNADTNQPIMTLTNGSVIDYAAIGTSRVTIVANVGSAKSVAFGMDGNGGMYNDNSNPFSFNGETNGTLNPYSFANGNHTVLATPFSGAYATGSAGSMFSVNFTVKNAGYVPQSNPTPAPVTQPSTSGPVVNSLVLYNVDTNQPIMTLTNGSVVDLSTIGTSRITIVADVAGAKSVAFGMDGNGGMYNDSGNPFSFNGETNGALNPYNFSTGTHTLLATPFSGAYATGSAGSMYKISFTVKNAGYVPQSAPAPTPAPTPSPTVGAPVPVITTIDNSVQAGHSIFVNALNSNLVSGDWIHAKMTWDFGDGGSTYNTLNGFNAAHAYERPGTYVVTLKLTNDAGKSAWAQTNVTVTAASRRAIYVSPWGNDNNSGTSTGAAVQSFARAAQLVGDNTEILFERNGTFNAYNSMYVGFNNVTVGSYGSGNLPVIRYSGAMKLGAQIISMNSSSRHVTVRDLTFDSVGGARDYDGMAQAIAPAGSDITIRDCQFLNLADAICANGKPTGLLVQDNTAPVGIRGYFAWVEGSDQSYIGNDVADSMYQHCLRNEGTDRLLIAFNNFDNEGSDVIKGTLNLHKGSYMYITGNTLTHGTMSIGPLGGPDGLNDKYARAKNVVLENNKIISDVQILHGAEHIMLDNNVVYGATGFGIDGYNAQYQRGVSDLNIINNTGINSGDRGNFLIVKGSVDGITLTNNLYVAPNLVTGSWGSAPVYVTDGGMNSFRTVKENVWPAVNAIAWAEGGSNFIGTSMVASGYQTPSEWDSWSQVDHDLFQAVYLSKSAQMVISGMTVGANLSLAA